jgi:hypothetical protein
MPTASLPPPLQAFAPVFAARLGAILAALARVIARRLLGHPKLAGFIVPLWRHLSRTIRRAENLARLLAAGCLPRPRPPHPSGPSGRCVFPANPRVLIAALGHEGATHIAQLHALLSAAPAVRLLAAVPAAANLLRTLGHLFGLPVPPRPQPETAPSPPPPAARTPAARPLPAASPG